jgi:periplasmic divalent cation tolerance protein
MSEPLLVLTTMPDEAGAKMLARKLVSEKMAACINLLPQMTSIYEWKGASEEGTEHLLLIKSTAEAYPRLEAAIREIHPYELPEIIATPISHGLPDYLNWIVERTQ